MCDSPIRMLLDWPSGFRGEDDVDGRRMDDVARPSYKLNLGSGELKLIATWHSLTPDPARSGGGGGGGMLAPVFCL